MINPLLAIAILAVGVTTALTVAIGVIVTASRMGDAINVLLDVADMLERDQRRLMRIKKLRRILSNDRSYQANGSTPPALYVPRYDQGGQQ